jgi:hypothetical protein
VVLGIAFAVVAFRDPPWPSIQCGTGSGAISVVVWVAVLPLTVGLWVWESTWPPLAGLVLVAGMVAWTLVAVAGLWRAVRPS